MAMFMPSRWHQSPTTTMLADGYTDDALASKYDNHRASRPLSFLSGTATSLGSRIRLSQFSLLEEDKVAENLIKKPRKMLGGQGRRLSTLELEPERKISFGPPPSNRLAKVKYYYDKYRCRHFAPLLLLCFYSLLGAWMFYHAEHEYEKEVKLLEQEQLTSLRSDTYKKILRVSRNGSRREIHDLFASYEKQLVKVKLPECLDWDMWGAIFYVGTLFTTIGYGNIAPRTTLGRGLSVVYAIIGIPLVLAILSQFGKALTNWLSDVWQRYRRHIKEASKKTKNRIKKKMAKPTIKEIEEGNFSFDDVNESDEVEIESSTIPVWLAFTICIGWVCTCAAIFLIWERKWTFFTSLYFFCISLSTIGLGDVVPDHPHMLILMFWLVIIGLSIVSMLLSVIQIKMEEWLYTLMIRMQKEYKRALANGEDVNKEEIIRNVMSHEPAWFRHLAPTMLTGEQTGKLEQTAEQWERILKESKEIQTDDRVAHGASTQVEKFEQSMACDPISDMVVPVHMETQYSAQKSPTPSKAPELHSLIDDRDSISDATSLPLDPDFQLGKKKERKVTICDRCSQHIGAAQEVEAQTDLAQFQIDEIALKLANLQTQRVRPPIVERSVATSLKSETPTVSISVDDFSLQCDSRMLSPNIKKHSTTSVGTEPERTQTTGSMTTNAALLTHGTDPASFSLNLRTTAVSPIPGPKCLTKMTSYELMDNIDEGNQTSRCDAVDVAVSTAMSNLLSRDVNTSPINGSVMSKTTATSFDAGSPDRSFAAQTSFEDEAAEAKDDRSIQTSIAEWFGKIIPRKDQTQQTSVSEELKKKKKKHNNKLNREDSCGTTCSSSIMSASTSSEVPEKKKETKNELSVNQDSGAQVSTNPMKTSLTESELRARSSSTSGMGASSIFDDRTRQEVIVQTEDSYLKIARRLDEYRTNKTQFLPVCAASPLQNKGQEEHLEQKSDRPSERRGFHWEPSRKRSVGTRSRRKRSQEMSKSLNHQGKSMELLSDDAQPEKSRSISPTRRTSLTRSGPVLSRKNSLPVGISRGKVSNFVHLHEKGIPNPATNRKKPVEIVRQYSVDETALRNN